MKGQREQNCLNKIKTSLLTKKLNYSEDDSKIIFRGDVCDDGGVLTYGFQLYNGRTPILVNEFSNDFMPILKLIMSAQNTDLKNIKTGKFKTEFPDFVCDNGLIEHFQISATKETRKGYQFERDNNKCYEEVKNKAVTINKNGKWPVYGSFQVHQSYDNFVKSFKSNWEKHISKLQKYHGNKDNVCFMIESNCFGLCIKIRNLKPNCDSDVTTGLIVEHYRSNNLMSEMSHFPLLGRCKELLEYIYQYKDEVQYVIFVSGKWVEILKTDMAQYIASLLGEYEPLPMPTIVKHSLIPLGN